MIDCDGLKKSMKYGHSTGDEFIKMTGSVLKMSFRKCKNIQIRRSRFLITVPGQALMNV
jgi:GGDEF domain-containing protein